MCADRKITRRHLDVRAARCSCQPSFTANGQISTVLECQAFCFAVELRDGMRSREVHCGICCIEFEGVCRDDARPRHGILRAECQRMTSSI